MNPDPRVFIHPERLMNTTISSGENSLTVFLAVWGAVLSSITFGWNLYRDLLDRARLKVEAQVRRIVRSPDGRWYQVKPDLGIAGASDQLFVVMNVTNIGRRPVQWQGWGGKHIKPERDKDSFTIVPTQLPKMLAEGETHSDLTRELMADVENIQSLFIWDAAGKKWYVSRKCLRKLKEDARKFRA
jgi:hypothetical protein